MDMLHGRWYFLCAQGIKIFIRKVSFPPWKLVKTFEGDKNKYIGALGCLFNVKCKNHRRNE